MKGKLIKTISLIMAMTLCFCLCVPVYANETNESIDEIETKIESLIIDFYKSKDIGTNPHIDEKAVSNSVSSFLSDKAEVQQYVTSLYETQKENYRVELKQLGVTEAGNSKAFRYQVITTYNYVDADFDTTVSEEVIVNYDSNDCKIINFVTPNNYYDVAVLKEDVKSSTASKKLNDTEEISRNKKRLINDINNVFKYETNTAEFDITLLKQPRAASSYNNSACVTYARNNYNKANPASGKSTISYYDFSTISGNFDCTNFVSHAISAGGANMYDTGGNGICSSGWYFRNMSNRSTSWGGVTQLYSFLTSNTKANTAAGIGKSYELSGAYWGIGDVLQLRKSGETNYGHSTIITIKKRSTDGKRCYAYVTGRSSKTMYNNNQAAADMAPGGSKRTIMIYNK